MLPVTVIAPAPKTSRGEEYGATVRDEGIREQTQAGQAVPGPGARAWDARRGGLDGGQDQGRLRAFFERVRARRGMQIAVVATARKLAVLSGTWSSRARDYAFQRPSLTEKKLRARVSAPPPCPRGAVRRAKRPPTRSRRCAGVRALSPSRASRATGSSSPTGRRKPPPQERARVPPLGSGSEAVKRQSCAAGFPSPRPALRSGVTRARDDSTTGGALRQLTFSSVQRLPRRYQRLPRR